jgi:hypothetical protein
VDGQSGGRGRFYELVDQPLSPAFPGDRMLTLGPRWWRFRTYTSKIAIVSWNLAIPEYDWSRQYNGNGSMVADYIGMSCAVSATMNGVGDFAGSMDDFQDA